MILKLLTCALLALPAAAQAEWYEAKTTHFAVYSNDTPDRLARYAEKLERFDKAMRVLRNVPDQPVTSSERVAVYVVRDSDDIESLSSVGVRGFYHASIEGPVAFVPRLMDNSKRTDLDADSVLRHEYSHHFMFDTFGNMVRPIWYVEGFAEFHATAIDQPDGSVMFGRPPLYRAGGLLGDESLSIRDVLHADNERLDLAQRNVVYAKGWALIHYLTFEPSRRGQLARYLAAMNAGQTSLQAAAVFGDLRTLDRDLAHYIVRPKIEVLTVDAKKLSIAAPQLRKLTAGEAATMDVRIHSKAGVSAKTAPAILSRAERAAAPYPNDPGAQLALAEAAMDAGDYGRALVAADRVIAVDRNNEKAYIYRGRALLGKAVGAKASDPKVWDDVRATFVAANRLDHDDPEALAYFYRIFRAAGREPTANGRAALHAALDFAPEDAALRFEVALDYIAHQEHAKARETLTTLAYSPHGGPAAKRASDLIAAIDKKDDAEIARLTQPDPPATKG